MIGIAGRLSYFANQPDCLRNDIFSETTAKYWRVLHEIQVCQENGIFEGL